MKKKQNPFKEFLNECAEWHAFWLGFIKTWMRLKIEKLPESLQKDIRNEYHYHLLGLALARILQIGIIILIVIILLRLWGM